MDFSLSSSLTGSAVLNPDKLSLDLQFAADKTLTARKGPTPTFTRGSTATFVGSNGLIQSAAVNIPRFDHNPITLACKGLLIEESRTNVALYSGALISNIGWAGGLISTVDGVAPNGGVAYELAETTATQSQTFGNIGGTSLTGATSVVSGTVYTGSIFLKKVTGSVDWVQITLGGGGFGTTLFANINLSTGAIGNTSGGTARVEAHANGWYRVAFIATASLPSSTSLNVIVGGTQNTNGTSRLPAYTGSTSNKFLAAMAQFETGSFATSYIPTTTASVIRSADVCSISGSDFTRMWNAAEGSLFASASFNAPTNAGVGQMMVDINDATTANRLRTFRGTTGVMAFFQVSGSTSNVEINQIAGVSPFTLQKTSAGFVANNYVFYVNNAQIGTDNLGALLVSPTTMNIGEAAASSASRQYTNGHIAAIRYFRKRLDNAKLQAITV